MTDNPDTATTDDAADELNESTTTSAEAITFTGANADEIRALGVHVIDHPTQDAIVVFTSEHAVDPVGTCAVGQVVQVIHDSGEIVVLIVGAPDRTALALPEADRFDPARSNVDEVLTYLASLGNNDEDQAERRRVLQLERDGKNRKTITATADDE